MLRLMMNNHPNLAIPHETAFITIYDKKLDAYGDLANKDNARRPFVDVSQHPLVKRGNLIADPEAVLRRPMASYRDFIDAIFQTYADSLGKARWGDKTPFYTPDIDVLHRIFPDAKFLHLVRDGRDVVESAGRSWRHAPGVYWKEQWASGAGAILRFVEGTGRQGRGQSWTLVKYEDLIREPERVVSELLAFLGVDEAAFNWPGLESIPLRGSSVRRGSRDRVHWEAVEKPRDFQPIGRWQHWRWSKRRLFKLLAGRELIRFGYVADSRW